MRSRDINLNSYWGKICTPLEIIAVDGKKRWKLLTASVTYFHGQPGDEVVILVTKEGDSDWAAVENVIKSNGR